MSEDIDWQGWQKTEHVNSLSWLLVNIEKNFIPMDDQSRF